MAWTLDGSQQLSVQGNIVQCAGGSGSSYNAMWKDGDGLTSGDAYWKIHFPTLDGGAFVGVTTTELFAPGYKGKCLCYGGNLSDGSVFLAGNFGPRFEANDTVGILASFQEDKLKIYFDHNDTPLGLAFEVPANCMAGGIYPCVRFFESGNATCTKATPPKKRDRPQKHSPGIEGSWKLQSPTPPCVPDDITLNIARTEGERYNVHLNVINRAMFSITQSNGNWTGSSGMSTKMAGPPELMQFEFKMGNLIRNPTNIQVVGSDLRYDSANAQSVWNRYEDSPKHYIGNPFS